MRKIILKIMVKEMNDLYKQREVSEETMALVEAVLERLEFHAFEEVLIWSEENASKALRRCLKNTLNEFKSGKLILTSSYPKLKHYSVDSVVNGLQTALTQAQEHQDNLNKQIDSLKAQLEQLDKVWISVDFMLPNEGEKVLIMIGDEQAVAEKCNVFGFIDVLDREALRTDLITYWMPLPKPPVKEAEGG